SPGRTAFGRRTSTTTWAGGPCTFPPAGTLFYVSRIPTHAAVAKLGNGARFRVSSRRGSQVRILAAASERPVGCIFRHPVGHLSLAPQAHAAPRSPGGPDRGRRGRRRGAPPPASPSTIRVPPSEPPPDRRRFPGLPPLHTSSEVPQRRLAFDVADVHGGADLFLDLHGECGPDCRDPCEIVRVRLLEVPQGFEAVLAQGATPNSSDPSERNEFQQFLLHA